MRSTSDRQPRISGTRWCNSLGTQIEHAAASPGGGAAGLLDDHGHGIGLVEQPQAPGLGSAPWCPCGYMNSPPRIRIRCTSATSEAIQRMLKSLRADAAMAREAFDDVAFDGRLPEALVGGIDGELAGLLRDGHVRVGEHEFAESAIEREAVHAAPEGQHQHGGGAVDGVARAQLLRARLQEVLSARRLRFRAAPSARRICFRQAHSRRYCSSRREDRRRAGICRADTPRESDRAPRAPRTPFPPDGRRTRWCAGRCRCDITSSFICRSPCALISSAAPCAAPKAPRPTMKLMRLQASRRD